MTIYGMELEDKLYWIEEDVLIMAYAGMIDKLDLMIERLKE